MANSLPRKIILASPREPCGATWLINCFLELGILTYRVSKKNMWKKRNGLYYLNKQQNILRKWLPGLANHKSFSFRSDIEVEWVHEWPVSKFDDCQVIYFCRDPRDALYSRYKREGAGVPFPQYLELLEKNTLLDKIESNCLHAYFWLQHPSMQLFRFEDYKNDSEGTLRNILRFIKVDASDNEIRSALQASTSEKAKEAENRYFNELSENSLCESMQVVNQGGVVGRWQELNGSDKDALLRIETISGHMMQHLGYLDENKEYVDSMEDYVGFLNDLFSFKNVKVFPRNSTNINSDKIAELESRAIDFAKKLTLEKMENAGMTKGEMQGLLYSLADFVADRDKQAFDNIQQTSLHFFSNPEFVFGLCARTRKIKYLARIDFPIILVHALFSYAGKRMALINR